MQATCEFLKCVGGLASVDEVVETLRAVLASLGVEYFVLSFLPTVNQHITDVMLVDTLPDGLLAGYNDYDFARVDPFLQRAHFVNNPFRWQMDQHIGASGPLGALAGYMHDYGLVDGVVVPVTSFNDRLGQVWFGGNRLDAGIDLRRLHIIALAAFDRMVTLRGDSIKPSEDTLTQREKDVLAYTISGLTSAERIGELMHISPKTVAAHKRKARQKLGAATTTQAAAIAIRDRIILP